MKFLWPLLSFLMFCAHVSAAQGYHLIPGDGVAVYLPDRDAPLSLRIDPDGRLWVPGIGAVRVEGQTLDAAQIALMDAAQTAGHYTSPQVFLTLEAPSPIIVAGSVTRPGAVAGGATSAITLVARAGGLSRTTLDPNDLARAQATLQGDLAVLHQDLAGQLALNTRWAAFLAGTGKLSPPAHAGQIPDAALIQLPEKMAAQQALLTEQTRERQELQRFWTTEIETLAQQVDLFDQRIAEQDGVIETAEQDLAAALALKDRGLQTTARFSAVEQRATNARSRRLELRQAKLATQRALAEARRDQTRYIMQDRRAARAALIRTTEAIAALTARRTAALRQLDLIRVGLARTLVREGAAQVVYHRHSPRPGRNGPIQAYDHVLPGETLEVSVVPTPPDLGG